MNLWSTWAGSPSSGALLARLELQTLSKILLQRPPTLRLAAGRVEFVKGFVIRGLKRLPIAL